MQVRSFFVSLSGVTELPKTSRNSLGSITAAAQEISLPSSRPEGAAVIEACKSTDSLKKV